MGVDTHFVMVPSPGGPVPTPTPMPFTGIIIGVLAHTVFIDGAAVALEGSNAQNMPPHLPTGGPFQRNPSVNGNPSVNDVFSGARLPTTRVGGGRDARWSSVATV
jgi:hypothetical protein